MALVVGARDFPDVTEVDLKVRSHHAATEHAQYITEDPAFAAPSVSVPSSATVVDLIVANTSRRGLIIYNNSTQKLYVRFAAGATTSLFTDVIEPFERWYMPRPIHMGVVTGIWASADGAALVTELT